MKISVIVANYNHAPYIEGAVKSVLNQTYEDLEIVIVDDGSTDHSKDVIADIKKLDKRINEPIFLEKNWGKWYALNKGIENSIGTLITLQDADDRSTPQRLEWQAKTLQMMKSYHNLCGFHNCNSLEELEATQKFISKNSGPQENINIMNHKEVVQAVYSGFNTPGINHYSTGNYAVHGASSLFYKQLWTHGMKFLPGNIGLRTIPAEDSDHNFKLTLLLQKTSILKEPFYCYMRGTSTNPAWLEKL